MNRNDEPGKARWLAQKIADIDKEDGKNGELINWFAEMSDKSQLAAQRILQRMEAAARGELRKEQPPDLRALLRDSHRHIRSLHWNVESICRILALDDPRREIDALVEHARDLGHWRDIRVYMRHFTAAHVELCRMRGAVALAEYGGEKASSLHEAVFNFCLDKWYFLSNPRELDDIPMEIVERWAAIDPNVDDQDGEEWRASLDFYIDDIRVMGEDYEEIEADHDLFPWLEIELAQALLICERAPHYVELSQAGTVAAAKPPEPDTPDGRTPPCPKCQKGGMTVYATRGRKQYRKCSACGCTRATARKLPA